MKRFIQAILSPMGITMSLIVSFIVAFIIIYLTSDYDISPLLSLYALFVPLIMLVVKSILDQKKTKEVIDEVSSKTDELVHNNNEQGLMLVVRSLMLKVEQLTESNAALSLKVDELTDKFEASERKVATLTDENRKYQEIIDGFINPSKR